MYIEHTHYHRLLRISAVVVAVVLVFKSGLLSESTARLTLQTEQYLATAVGVRVGVEPTELNQITAALTEREQQLAAREAELREREIAVNLNEGGATADSGTYILSAILFILLVLIILNYVLDLLRVRKDEWHATA